MGAYDLRVYHVADGQFETLELVLRELALPMMPEYGMRTVGFWADRDANTLYQISEHESLEVVEGNWNRFHADPRWLSSGRRRRCCGGSAAATSSSTTPPSCR